jgi:hypothetical protein
MEPYKYEEGRLLLQKHWELRGDSIIDVSDATLSSCCIVTLRRLLAYELEISRVNDRRTYEASSNRDG